MLAASCSFGTMNVPATAVPVHNPSATDVAEKVMRRVEIAKVARNLQDCLAFASFKAQHGWQDRTLKSIEPEIAEKLLRRKRPFTDQDLPSDASSSIYEGSNYEIPAVQGARKRLRALSASGVHRPSQSASWKQDHHLPQSSPADQPTPFDASYPSLHDSPMFDAPDMSDDEGPLPMSAVQEPSSSIISSSPPRTPPPVRRGLASSKQTGADLLLYLANSPRSPAIHVTRISSTSKEPPSTPPSQHSHLPSSVMQTPGTSMGLFNGALQTPGQNFNFADFCNVTPSPGQAHWGSRTPAMSKTPARLARRSLNFETLAPPTSNPTAQHKTPTGHGLALQLGDELVPQ